MIIIPKLPKLPPVSDSWPTPSDSWPTPSEIINLQSQKIADLSAQLTLSQLELSQVKAVLVRAAKALKAAGISRF